MKRSHALGLLLLALASAPAAVLAQDDTDDATNAGNTSGGISVQLIRVGSKAYRSTSETPIGRAACDGNAALVFRLTGLETGTDAPTRLWIMSGDNCNATSGRDGEGKDCVTIDTLELDDKQAQADIEVDIEPLCNPDGEPDLYFLPVDRINTSEAVSPYGYFQVPVDVDPPAAPSDVTGGGGETEIPVSWDRGTGNPINYWLVWDPEPTAGGAAGSGDTDGGAEAGSGGTAGSADNTSDGGGSTAACGSTKLIPGTVVDVDELPPGIRRKRVEGDVTNANLSGSEIGGQRAAVSVIAEDLAGNQSVLSDFACVRVVATLGFWDAYRDSGGEAEAGCACSVPSARRSPLSALPVVLALFLLRVRRKRRS